MSIEVPHDWEPTTLSEACAFFTDGDWVESKDQNPDGEVRLIQLADIGDGVFLDKSNRFLTAQKARDLRCSLLEQGDLLIARMAEPIARCCLFPGLDQPAATVVDIAIARAREGIDQSFLSYAVSDRSFRELALGAASGTTRSRISRSNLGALPILLPPLDEQRRIAEVMRSLDEVIAREHEVRVAAEASLEHALVAMMPEPEMAYGEWTVTTIGEFAIVSTGKTPSTKDSDLWGGDIPFVTPTDMDGSVRSVRAARSVTKAAIKHTKIAPANSVLFTCIASIGKLCLNEEPVAFNQQINACACRDANDAEFLYWTLRRLTPKIKALSGTTAVPIVNKTAFSRVSFATPTADTRREIVAVLSSISEIIEASNRTISSLTELKRRISSDLLSGNVRVPA